MDICTSAMCDLYWVHVPSQVAWRGLATSDVHRDRLEGDRVSTTCDWVMPQIYAKRT